MTRSRAIQTSRNSMPVIYQVSRLTRAVRHASYKMCGVSKTVGKRFFVGLVSGSLVFPVYPVMADNLPTGGVTGLMRSLFNLCRTMAPVILIITKTSDLPFVPGRKSALNRCWWSWHRSILNIVVTSINVCRSSCSVPTVFATVFTVLFPLWSGK